MDYVEYLEYVVKFGDKRAPKSCQDLGQKDMSKLDENCVKKLQQRHCRGVLSGTARVLWPGTAGLMVAALPVG
jgi:hypothetical protein